MQKKYNLRKKKITKILFQMPFHKFLMELLKVELIFVSAFCFENQQTKVVISSL